MYARVQRPADFSRRRCGPSAPFGFEKLDLKIARARSRPRALLPTPPPRSLAGSVGEMGDEFDDFDMDGLIEEDEAMRLI